MKPIVIFLFALLLMSCTANQNTKYKTEAEKVIGQSYGNKQELESVIEHYKTVEPSPEQLQAAYFLIAGMDIHSAAGANDSATYRSMLDTVTRIDDPYGWSPSLSTVAAQIEGILNQYPVHPFVASDPIYITADYLIGNIDDAYDIWGKTAWHKDYTFDDFCEWVLPYRTSNERLELWRPMARQAVVVPDSILASGDPVEIARHLITHTEIHYNVGFDYWPIPLTFSDMCYIKRGVCYDMSHYALMLMRAYGIPSAVDAVPVWANRSQAHMWNAVILPGGKSVDLGYNANGANPIVYKLSKIYRRRYSPLREDILYRYKDSEPIPRFFRALDRQDVTAEYGMPVTTVTVEDLALSDHRLTWLATFENEKWYPVAYGEKKGNRATFKDMARGILHADNTPIQYIDAGKGVLYLPGYFNGIQIVPAAPPFILQEDGQIRSLIADTVNRQTLVLSRKYPKNPDFAHYEKGMVKGRFEGANRSDFSDAVTLLEINRPQAYPMEEFAVILPGQYRYVRYLAPKDSWGNVAEVQFRKEGQTLTGKPIGIEGENAHFYPASLFDGNMESYFEVRNPSGAVWAGLDLGRPQPVTSIAFAARTDDNDVRLGDTYELFYWMPKGWESAGTQVAATYRLTWPDLPSGTIYLLRDLTRGREQRPFTYENGRQVWW